LIYHKKEKLINEETGIQKFPSISCIKRVYRQNLARKSARTDEMSANGVPESAGSTSCTVTLEDRMDVVVRLRFLITQIHFDCPLG